MYSLSLFRRLPFHRPPTRDVCILNQVVSTTRHLHTDGRNRLSNFWTPTSGAAKEGDGQENAQSLLIKGGFIRQAHAGLFQFLPLGLRVQNKLEVLLDHHMSNLGASKVSLSTLSSEALWTKSGRLDGGKSELFRLEDRKGSKFLLSPTHEEEITSIIADSVHSYRDLPLRLYQITRKYRDELRPRQGLLRSREFLMKDLYTFDATKEQALQTYERVQETYSAFFKIFKIPFLVAKADSGNIGGDLSHEYHLPSSNGEDTVFSCDSCTYTANEEVATRRLPKTALGKSTTEDFADEQTSAQQSSNASETVTATTGANEKHPNDHLSALMKDVSCWISPGPHDQKIYFAFTPREIAQVRNGVTKEYDLNRHVLKWALGCTDLEPLQESFAFPKGAQVGCVFDNRIRPDFIDAWTRYVADMLEVEATSLTFPVVDLSKVQHGDLCPHCEAGTLMGHKAIELGHTFHLGTKYSEPLRARIIGDTTGATTSSANSVGTDLEAPQSNTTAIEMGCHGIGVSRMIAALADVLADEKGLNWPRAVAPFDAVIIPAKGFEDDAIGILDTLAAHALRSTDSSELLIDAILDDREKELPWKLKDADLIGYPVIVVLGRAWKREKKCEVQCRRLKLRKEVSLSDLRGFVTSVLARL